MTMANGSTMTRLYAHFPLINSVSFVSATLLLSFWQQPFWQFLSAKTWEVVFVPSPQNRYKDRPLFHWCSELSSGLYCRVTTQKTALNIILAAVRTWNLSFIVCTWRQRSNSKQASRDTVSMLFSSSSINSVVNRTRHIWTKFSWKS
jgi:hypothetical protein